MRSQTVTKGIPLSGHTTLHCSTVAFLQMRGVDMRGCIPQYVYVPITVMLNPVA